MSKPPKSQKPGRYDDICAYARKRAEAKMTILIVVDGKRGSGFSVQIVPERGAPPPHAELTTALLRRMADEIEQRELGFVTETETSN